MGYEGGEGGRFMKRRRFWVRKKKIVMTTMNDRVVYSSKCC